MNIFEIIVSIILAVLMFICLEYGSKIFKKKRKTPKQPIEQNVPVAEENLSTWVVYWYSIMDHGFHKPSLTHPLRRAKAFTSEESAQAFVEKLKDAYKLLQCGYEICIYVEKQQ